MPNYLFDKLFNINGRNIHCKVTGEYGSETDNQAFVLLIPGGPGLSSRALDAMVDRMLTSMAASGTKPPHFILYDPLSCGTSDKAVDPKNEYTFDNFTEIAAKVVEEVKEELGLESMQLITTGVSFGGMIAVNLPMNRPEWLEPSSPIQLKLIVSVVTPNKLNENNNASTFIDVNYGSHPKYADMKMGVQKILSGTLLNHEDFVKSIVIALGPLYADKNEVMLNGFFGRLLQYFPVFIPSLVSWAAKWSSHKYLQYMDSAMEFNHTVMNHFFMFNNDSLKLDDLVAQNKALYARVPLCCIGANRDYIANSRQNAVPLQAALPQNSALIEFDSKHSIGVENPELSTQIFVDLFTEGFIDEAKLKRSQGNYRVSHFVVPDGFKTLLKKSFNSAVANSVSSTGFCLTQLGQLPTAPVRPTRPSTASADMADPDKDLFESAGDELTEQVNFSC